MRRFSLLVLCAVTLLAARPSWGQGTAPSTPPPDQSQLIRSAEKYIRNLFTWGPDYKLKLGPLGQSPASDFYSLPIEVTYKDQSENATFYLSKDGKIFIRGDMLDTSADPFAANRAKLHIDGNPSKGPANARVTIVEFSDFECPHCREVHKSLQTIQAQFPQVRLVFKDFPLNEIHPWSETAAIGARCAFMQSPASFWKMQDLIFDNQDVISASNVFDQVVTYARQLGLDAPALQSCMSSPEPKKAVDSNRADGVALEVNSTPTLFVNGRRLVGGDAEIIAQFINFELAQK
jgi:protein-disulfide isomerase